MTATAVTAKATRGWLTRVVVTTVALVEAAWFAVIAYGAYRLLS
jgi:hypothetical protein